MLRSGNQSWDEMSAEETTGRDTEPTGTAHSRRSRAFAHDYGRSRTASAGASRLVAAMKLLLPAMALSLIALVIAWPQLLPDEKEIKLGDARISVKDIDNLRMTEPRFVGVDEKSRAFEMTARSASQSSSDSNLVNLESPQADMVLESGKWVTVTSATGVFDKTSRMVDLDGGVVVYHDDGYEMATEYATIDMESQSVVSEASVAGHGPTGLVQSEGFQIFEGGKRILFTGKAHLILRMSGQ